MIKSLFSFVAIFTYFLFAPALNAEFILARADNAPLKPKEMSSDEFDLVEDIYKNILFKYQWPMITMYFDELSPLEQSDYLAHVRGPKNVGEFLDKKLVELGYQDYRVVFVPNGYLELTVLKLLESKAAQSRGGPKSKVYSGDLTKKFSQDFHNRFTQALADDKSEYDSLSYLVHAYEPLNQNRKIVELYVHAAADILTNFTTKELADFTAIEHITTKLFQAFTSLQNKFVGTLRNRHSDVDDMLATIGINSIDFTALENTDLLTLIVGNENDLTSYKNNEFNLYRSTIRTKKFIESLLSEEDSVALDDISLDFRNSLLAGTFNSGSILAPPLLMRMRDNKFGYVLHLPIGDYLENNKAAGVSLRDKYFIAPINTVAAMFADGSINSSRSKLSQDYKSGNEIDGINDEIDSLIRSAISANRNFLLCFERSRQDLANSIMRDIAMRSRALHDYDWYSPFEKRAQNNVVRDAGHPKKWMPNLLKRIDDFYSKDNSFYRYAHDPAFAQSLLFSDDHVVAFDDKTKRTKVHSLIIPKGSYGNIASFAHRASTQEHTALIKSIATVAQLLHVDETGFRVVINTKGDIDNYAEQSVMHMHMHIAGGECLESPFGVYRLDDNVDKLPAGFKLNKNNFYNFASKKPLYEHDFGAHTFLAYEYPVEKGLNKAVPTVIGFMIYNNKKHSAYSSIMDFAQRASEDEISMFLKFVVDIADREGFSNFGYRLVSNHGLDAQQLPRGAFQVFLIGKAPLQPTVSSVFDDRSYEERQHIVPFALRCPVPLKQWMRLRNNYDFVAHQDFRTKKVAFFDYRDAILEKPDSFDLSDEKLQELYDFDLFDNNEVLKATLYEATNLRKIVDDTIKNLRTFVEASMRSKP